MASLKNDFYDIYLSWEFELRKHLKRKRVPIMAALAIIVPLLFYISPADVSRDFASNSLMFVTFLIILSAAMFMGDSISGEFERKTGLLLFPTPQKRTAIFAGKYLAALTATLMAVSIYYLIVNHSDTPSIWQRRYPSRARKVVSGGSDLLMRRS